MILLSIRELYSITFGADRQYQIYEVQLLKRARAADLQFRSAFAAYHTPFWWI